MSVKDVLQSLVDDGMVDSDRIGTSNYFWAFPSKASNQVGSIHGNHWSMQQRDMNPSPICVCVPSGMGYSFTDKQAWEVYLLTTTDYSTYTTLDI